MSTQNPLQKQDTINPKQYGIFTNYIYKAIPLAFDNSMSYEQTLCGLLAFLENTIIPSVNNDITAVNELKGLYTELKNFVDHYFDNLDVQEEINNKLDAMVEDGSLEAVIGPYLQPYIDAQNEEIDNFKTTVNGRLDTQDGEIDNFKTSTNTEINNFKTTVNGRLDTQDGDIDVLEQRMDGFTHLTDGSTSGDAELQDIRIGFNGTTYSTAGDSVRGQANQVNQYKSSLLTSLFSKKTITWQTDKRINNNGVLTTTDATGWKTSDPIPLDSKYILFDYKYTFPSSLTFTYFFNFYQDDNIAALSWLGGVNPDNATISTECYGNLLKINVPEGTNYVSISVVATNLSSVNVYDTSFDLDLITDQIDYGKLKDIFYYENILNGEYTGGTIATDGTINSSTTHKVTGLMACEPNTVYFRKNTAGGTCLIGCYDENQEWIKRRGTDAGFFITPEDCHYIRFNDSNADMVEQVVGRYYVGKFLGYEKEKDLYIEESDFVEQIIDLAGKELPDNESFADSMADLIQSELPKDKLYNKNICILGDSIAYGIGASDRETKSWASLLASNTGANITNLAISGASLQYRASAESVAKSVYTVSTETDFSTYDYVIISAGGNDILANIGTPSSTNNTDACGALNLIVQNILTSNPYCQIFFFGPMFRARFNQGDGHNSDDYALDGKWVIDLADNLESTAEKNHIPNKNMYRRFELNKYNSSVLMSDGLHPNDLGHERIYKVIHDFIDSNI